MVILEDISPSTTTSNKSSRRDLLIDVVVSRFLFFLNNQKTLFPCFTIIPKTKKSFYCEGRLSERKNLVFDRLCLIITTYWKRDSIQTCSFSYLDTVSWSSLLKGPFQTGASFKSQ